jgi:hypothetical protein
MYLTKHWYPSRLEIDRPDDPALLLRHASEARFGRSNGSGTEGSGDAGLGYEGRGDRPKDGSIAAGDLRGHHQRLPQVRNNKHGAVDALGLGDGPRRTSASRHGRDGGGTGQESAKEPADSDGADSKGAEYTISMSTIALYLLIGIVVLAVVGAIIQVFEEKQGGGFLFIIGFWAVVGVLVWKAVS